MATKNIATGLLLALVGSIAFSGKAIIVKLAYRYGVDAVTLIMYRMLFALPLFLAAVKDLVNADGSVSEEERRFIEEMVTKLRDMGDA